MKTSYTVRAFCVTNRNSLVVIKRERPGLEPYWVFPGGGVEDTDSTLELALERELREELGATVEIGNLLVTWTVPQTEETSSRQYFYFCKLLCWNVAGGDGAEWSPERKSGYAIEEFPLDGAAIDGIKLLPREVHHYVLTNRADLAKALPVAVEEPVLGEHA